MVYKTAKKVKSTKNNKLDPNGSIKTFMSAAEQTGFVYLSTSSNNNHGSKKNESNLWFEFNLHSVGNSLKFVDLCSFMGSLLNSSFVQFTKDVTSLTSKGAIIKLCSMYKLNSFQSFYLRMKSLSCQCLKVNGTTAHRIHPKCQF